MGNVSTSGCALVLFGFLVLFASRALAEDCTPVVYAFRHAEDTNPPSRQPLFALTPTGQRHAQLYPTMVSVFAAANHFCPVTKVYATTKAGKVGNCGQSCASATNAFDTATPLASEVMAKAEPITTVAGHELYEYLGNGDGAPPDPVPVNYYTSSTATALRTELLATANLGQSSAIFWTSQGLHVLGGAIIYTPSNSKPSNVPIKQGSAIPPRNAVYVFTAVGSAPRIEEFDDTPLARNRPSASDSLDSSVYVQCFNHVEGSTQPNITTLPYNFTVPTGIPRREYYCGYDDQQSNLGGKPPACELGCQCGTIPNDYVGGPKPACCSKDPKPVCCEGFTCDTPPGSLSNFYIKGKICNTTILWNEDIPGGAIAGSMLPDTWGTKIFGACY